MRDTTTKYQVTIHVPGVCYTPTAWNCKRDGRPNEGNLRMYVARFEASTLPGGVNAHLGIEIVKSAQIRRNDGSAEVVASYVNPGVPGAASAMLITEQL